MRSPRTVVVFLALVLAATLAATAPAATAREESRPAPSAARADVTGTTPASSARVAADDITVTSRVVRKRLKPKRPVQLLLVGTVEPRTGPVWIQRATRCSRKTRTCNYEFFGKRYLHQGRYQIVIDAPPTQRSWLWRAKVKESYSEEWQTCTKRPEQDCKIPFTKPKGS